MKSTRNVAVDKAKTQIQETAHQLADQASAAVETGKQEAVHFIEEKKETAAHTVRDLDQALRRTAEQVENPGMGRMIESLAGEVDRLANMLETTRIDDMLSSAERMSRQNPTLFMATAFGLGLAAARFVRASARHQARLPQTIY
jgi:hypothetical protein